MIKLLRRGFLAVMIISAGIVSAQENAEVLSGTPVEICEASVPAEEPQTRTFAQAETVITEGIDYRAIFCTDAGAVYVDLLEDYAPMTVNSFVFLAENGYYNNTIFHRVIADFMAQGGDPTATGTGGPGYQFEDETEGFLTFDRPGLLAMANAGPGTNGSQFFITTVPTQHLNYKHTIFGSVLEGFDAVTAIQLRDPADATAPATTLQTVVIVTDPSTVTTDYVNPLTVADSAFFTTQLNLVGSEENMPPDLIDGYVAPVVVTQDEIIASTPEEASSALSDLLNTNEFDFRVTMVVGNPTCSQEYFFEELTYTVDAFKTADEATAVLNSDAFIAANAAEGFTPLEGSSLFTQADVTSCTGNAGLGARAYLQRGRYLVRIGGVFTASIIEQAGQDVLARVMSDTVPQLFEPFITDAYRAELP